MCEVKTKHELCLEVLRDPRNREFLEQTVRSLAPGGTFIWKDEMEPFTREELVKLLEDIKKKAN